jgi:hypothetical protein
VDTLVEEYKDLVTSPIGVPLHYQVKHPIDLIPGSSLTNGPIYICSLWENEEIKCQIHDLTHKGHIQLGSSPCGIPIMLVQKNFRTWWLCIDYIALNKIIVKNQYMIPHIEDLLDQLKGPKFFNKIDLKLSYHQVLIELINIWKSTFKSKEGLFEWLVIPFVLTNALMTFMRMMGDILYPFKNSFVVVYLDGIFS